MSEAIFPDIAVRSLSSPFFIATRSSEIFFIWAEMSASVVSAVAGAADTATATRATAPARFFQMHMRMPPRAKVSRGRLPGENHLAKGGPCAESGHPEVKPNPVRQPGPRGPAPAGLLASLKEEQPAGKLNTAESPKRTAPRALQCEQLSRPARLTTMPRLRRLGRGEGAWSLFARDQPPVAIDRQARPRCCSSAPRPDHREPADLAAIAQAEEVAAVAGREVAAAALGEARQRRAARPPA